MWSHFLLPFIASLFSAIVATIGLIVAYRFEKWGRKYVVYFSSFAAGLLISVSFLYIIPKSFLLNPILAPACLLGGYLMMYFLNRFITQYVCHGPLNSTYVFGLIPMVGIGIHSFIDGIIFAITFAVSPFMGILATSGMILHEFSEGLITYLLLVYGGFSKRISFLLAFLAAALTTPLGVIVTSPFLRQIDKSMLGILLSISAGSLVYVGATHLLPHVESEAQKYSIIALMTGVVMAIIIILSGA